MRRGLFVVAAILSTVATSASAAPPRHGVLVPGRSLGGVHLGDSQAAVRTRFGGVHGACTRCATTTWYFTYRPFTQQGVGVEFRRGRVSSVFTLWEPVGWRTSTGVALGMPKWRLPQLTPQQCNGYLALYERRRNAITSYYVVAGRIWAFALLGPGEPICR